MNKFTQNSKFHSSTRSKVIGLLHNCKTSREKNFLLFISKKPRVFAISWQLKMISTWSFQITLNSMNKTNSQNLIFTFFVVLKTFQIFIFFVYKQKHFGLIFLQLHFDLNEFGWLLNFLFTDLLKFFTVHRWFIKFPKN